MAFLFKSKKNNSNNQQQQQQNSALPAATRNVHTSEGAPSTTPSALNGVKDRESGLSQTPTPSSSYNNSLSSVANPSSPDLKRVRQRADSESQIQRQPSQAMNGTIPSPQTSPNASLYPWSQRRVNFSSPQMNPFPRYGAAINSVASKEGDIYMMGGLIDGATVKGDLWMMESSSGNLSCVPIVTVSEGPGPRVGHASLLVGNAFIVFGGDTKMDENDTLDDTLYLLNTSSRQWSRAIPPGTRPTGRYGHTLNILGSKLYVFGGQVEGFFFNDLVAFDLNQLQNPANKWEFLIRNSHEGGPSTSSGLIPPARTNHTIVSFNDRLYLFGGTNGVQWFNDVWSYDPRANQWTQLECVGFIPTPREGHAAALVNDVMYIFGGRTDEGMDLGDLAAFRISTRRWYSFQNMGPAPSPRSGHSMTASGKQIIVTGGEPSSAPRDPVELSMAYILDTAKIRYPVEAQNGEKGAAAGGVRKMSTDKTSPMSASGRTSREAQHYTPDSQGPRKGPTSMPSHESMSSSNGGHSPAPGSRLPRASIAQAPSGPPPPGQAPTPGPRGSAAQPAMNPRSKTPTKLDRGGFASPPLESARSLGGSDNGRDSPAKELSSPKEAATKPAAAPEPQQAAAVPPTGGEIKKSPSQQHQQHQQQSRMSAKAMEAGEAAPLISQPARQRSMRQRQRSSVDSTDESILGRQASVDGSVESRSLRNSKTADEPRSPKLNVHQEALAKELEAAKSRNAWYASELALAKKAGYAPNPSGNNPVGEDRTPDMFSDEDRPLIEAFLAMRAELAKMQATVDRQAAIASKRVAEVEHQRDLAVNEAAYSRAKLAAHGGSQRGTPLPDGSAQDDPDGAFADRGTDISRRLAAVLASQSHLTAKLETMTTDLEQEKRSRELADETSEATRKRLVELEAQTNSLELENLRSELHKVEASAREEALQRSQAETALKRVTFDKEELARKFEESSVRLRDYNTNLGTLREAVSASSGKSTLIEKQLAEEREIREGLERKLLQLRSEHEERGSDLDNVNRRLRDAQELAESHAKEAETHKIAFLSGLERASSFDLESTSRSVADQRVETLEAHVAKANELAKANQAAADAATEKLRRAEERIAGLEAYQEQASREGLQLRRQLQTMMKESQSASTANRDLKSKLENHLRDAGALAIQHSALKDLLGERGSTTASSRGGVESPGSRYDTPEQGGAGRLKELEQQLSASTKAHDELKSYFETREQEADRAYREKLEQLENDYQSAVHYVKGTEKMLKRMKDELGRYKTQNVKLQSDLEAARNVQPSEAPAEWETERSKLHQSVSDLQQDTKSKIGNLERQILQLKQDVTMAEEARGKSQNDYEEVKKQLVAAAERSRDELDQLKSENHLLETRATDAEQRVTMLLDQVESSVGHFRRQSQHGGQGLGTNGISRTYSDASSSNNTAGGRARADSSASQDEPSSAFPDNRGSMALDSLANELESLRSHWESTNRNYRLSMQSDMDRTPTKETYEGNVHGGLSDSLAEWRRRLDEEESRANSPAGVSKNKSGLDSANMI